MIDRKRRVRVDLFALSALVVLDTSCGGQSAEQPAVDAAVAEPSVRVLLRRGQSSGPLTLRTFAGYRVVDDSGGSLVVGEHGTTATVSVGEEGLRWNETALRRQRVAVMALDDEVELAARTYRGHIRLIQTAGGGVAVVNVLPIESYLRAVLRGEMPRRFHPAAQRAQAIAARTYALYQCSVSPPGADFDLYAGQRSQVYRGAAAEDARADAAVRKTRGLVLTTRGAGGRIFEAVYSSTCGGATLSASVFSGRDPVEPLRGGVICEDCAAARSPFLRWRGDVRIAKLEVRDALLRRFPDLSSLGALTNIEIAQRGAANRPTLLRLIGQDNAERAIRPEELRVAVGGGKLPSSWFEIETDGEDFIFTDGRGFGHGAGLCQYGAQGMAGRGKSTLEILSHYYPGSTTVRAY